MPTKTGPLATAAHWARAIRAREVSSVEALQAHFERQDACTDLKALVWQDRERALAQARAADDAMAHGEVLGPLHGVPVTLKECLEAAGTPNTWGLTTRRDRQDSADEPVVAALRAAGAIVMGKTNVSQLLIYAESDNPVYGRTGNPWRPDERTPGGSSGGEAALIAAGGSPLGLGTDIGGSVRIPAHFCGIHAFKPTSGCLRLAPPQGIHHVTREGSVMGQPGPLARSTEDLILAMEILCQSPAGDRPLPDPAGVSLRGLRIAAYVDDGVFPAAPAIRRAVTEAARALEDRGAVVEWVTPPDTPTAMALYLSLVCPDGGAGIRASLAEGVYDPRLTAMLGPQAMPAPMRALLPPVLRLLGQHRSAGLLPLVGPKSPAEMARLVAERARYQAQFAAWLEAGRFEALLCPPYALPALPHGASGNLTLAGSYSMLFNLLGYPAGVVPVTTVGAGEESDRPVTRDRIDQAARAAEAGSAGLPVGVQVAARPWREDVALALMAALEAAFGARRPAPVR